ncbi:MAG: hypothetical protein QM831_17770 [Kofleriaceae bacterium]
MLRSISLLLVLAATAHAEPVAPSSSVTASCSADNTPAIAKLTLVADDDDDDDESSCLSDYGKTACGYHCIANYGQVRCSATPAGACLANYGKVVCWDPPRRAYRHHRRRIKQASCLADYNQIACGYDCVANYGEVACSSVPWGSCAADYGHVTCSN